MMTASATPVLRMPTTPALQPRLLDGLQRLQRSAGIPWRPCGPMGTGRYGSSCSTARGKLGKGEASVSGHFPAPQMRSTYRIFPEMMN